MVVDANQTKNIYVRLSELDPNTADKITNAKTNGGRALDAIWAIDLTTNQKVILMYLGSQLNYCADFANQYRFVSISKIAKATAMSRSTVIRTINGHRDGKSTIIGLVELGYVQKKLASVEEQAKGFANHYCITKKLFDDYISILIDREEKDNPYGATPYPPLRNAIPPLAERHTPPSGAPYEIPVLVPKVIPVVIPVCGETTPQTHTETKNGPVESKIDPDVPKKTRKQSWKFKKDSNDEISTEIQWKLSNMLRAIFKSKYIGNSDCAEIIQRAMGKTNCSVDDVRIALNAATKHNYDFVTSDRFDIDVISNDLSNFIFQKDKIIEEIEKKRIKEEEIKKEQEKRAALFYKEQQEKTLEKEINERKEAEKLKEKEKEDFEKLPNEIKLLFKKLNFLSKKQLLKEIDQLGLENFVNMRFPAMKMHDKKEQQVQI